MHADVDRVSLRLQRVHAARLHCARGCSGCCVDDLTVFEVEAAEIRLAHAELLAHGVPHAVGACAFLDADGGCRIYAERPYVCRTQGLPLRWIDDDASVELRDICPLNDAGDPPLETIPADDCWTLGAIEARLSRLQLAAGGGGRVLLRALFAAATTCIFA